MPPSTAFESKLDKVVRRHAELRDAMADPARGGEFAKLSKEYSDLTPLVESVETWQRARAEQADLEALAGEGDSEMKALADAELLTLQKRIPELEHQIKILLLPKDEADERNAIIELRAGTGGDEAGLFASELFRMYQRYAAIHGWRFEVMDYSESDVGGIKEATASITGRDVFIA